VKIQHQTIEGNENTQQPIKGHEGSETKKFQGKMTFVYVCTRVCCVDDDHVAVSRGIRPNDYQFACFILYLFPNYTPGLCYARV